MTERIVRELEAVRRHAGAAAVILWEMAPGADSAFVVATAPDGLLPAGTPWLAHEPGVPALTSDPCVLPLLLPVALRLALPTAVSHARVQSLPGTRLKLTMAWSQAPSPARVRALAAVIDAQLRPSALEFTVRQRLSVEQARLQTVLGMINQAVVAIDALRQEAMINRAGERLLGVHASSVPASVMAQALHRFQAAALNQEDVAELACRLARQPDATVTDVVWRFAKPPTHVRVATAPVDGAGESGRIWVFDDISEQMTSLEALALSQARLRVSVDGMLDPQVLLTPVRDRSGVIIDFIYLEVNRAATEYLSTSRDALIGRSLLETTPGVKEAGLFALYLRVMERDEPLVVDDFLYDSELFGAVRRYDIRAARAGTALTLTWRDSTERFDAQARIAESERHYRLLAENSADVVVLVRAGRIDWVSPSLTRTLGWHPSEWIGQFHLDYLHPDDHEAAIKVLATIAEVMETRVLRLRVRARSGQFHWAAVHAKAYIGPDGRQEGHVASFRTIDAEVAAEAAVARLARFDALTGLANRNEAVQRFAERQARTRRPGEMAAVLFCDVDRFKSINDTHGHAAGDEALRVLAERIRACLRSEDICARMGGDELLVIVDGIHALEEARAIAEKIRQAAERPIPVGTGRVATSLSIGVALAKPGEDFEPILARADAAMYEAKKNGRNQIVLVG